MKLVRSIAFSLSVAVVPFAAVACGGTVEHAPQTGASAVTKAPIGTNTHGAVKLVGEALAEVPLRPDQRAEIEKLAVDAEARHAPMADGRKELMLAFADQVEKGAIDKAALQPKLDKITADLEKIRVDDRAALVKLHDLLDASQRNAFVDALEQQMKARRGEHGSPANGFAHAKEGFGHLKELADELKLSDAQKTQIHDVMREAHGQKGGDSGEHARHGRHHAKGESPGHAEWRAHHGGHAGKRPLEAFREDKLDLDKVAPQHGIKGMAHLGSDRMTGFAEKVLPILTPEQRKLAADKLRGMAASGDARLLGH